MKIGMLLKCWLSETFFKVLCKMKEFFFFTQWVVNMELLIFKIYFKRA